MNTVSKSILGVALTAGAVYFFDPASGRRRRVLLRDQCARAARKADLGTRDIRDDLAHRMHHFAEGARNHIAHPTSDNAVRKHARAALVRAVSHPEAIDCTVHDGHVYLRGDVYSHELQRALNEIRRVPGVHIITDHLTPREAAEGVRPLLNSSGARADGWSIAGRLFAGATGCALLVWGVRERKALGAFGASLGESLRHMSKMDAEQSLDHIADAIEKGLDAAEEAASDIGAKVDAQSRKWQSEAASSAEEKLRTAV